MQSNHDIKPVSAADSKKDFNYLCSQIQDLVEAKEAAENYSYVGKDQQVNLVMTSVFEKLFTEPMFQFIHFISAKHIGDPGSVLFFTYNFDAELLEELKRNLKKEFVAEKSILTLAEFFALTPPDVTNAMYQDDAKALFSSNRYQDFYTRDSQDPVVAIKVKIDAIFQFIWPAIKADLVTTLAFPFQKVSDTFQASFAAVQVNYRATDPISSFLLTDLVEKNRLAHLVFTETVLPNKLVPPLCQIVKAYLNVPGKFFSIQDIEALQKAIGTTGWSARDGHYTMTFPYTAFQGHVQIVEYYFNSLAQGSSFIEVDGKKEEPISLKVTYRGLLGSIFFADLAENIQAHPQLVKKFREKTLYSPVTDRLNEIGTKLVDLVDVKEFNTIEDSKDESAKAAKTEPTSKPCADAMIALAKYIEDNGLADEEKLRALIASVKKAEADFMQKLQKDVKESHSRFVACAIKELTAALESLEQGSSNIKSIGEKGLTDEEKLNALMARVKLANKEKLQQKLNDAKESFTTFLFFGNANINALEALKIFKQGSPIILELIQKLENIVDNKFVKKLEELPDQEAMTRGSF